MRHSHNKEQFSKTAGSTQIHIYRALSDTLFYFMIILKLVINETLTILPFYLRPQLTARCLHTTYHRMCNGIAAPSDRSRRRSQRSFQGRLDTG